MKTIQDTSAKLLPPSDLKAWKLNPRKNDGAVELVAASIRELGFGAPIVAREKTFEIIAGHTRWKAALSLGLKVVPVRLIKITDAKAAAMALADNKLGEIAAWDDDLLSEVLAGMDDDLLELSGFSLDDQGAPGDPPVDEAPALPETPVSKPGDIWALGPHRLFCGSCLDLPSVLGSARADLLVTDPPYGVDYAGKQAALNAADGGDRNTKQIQGDAKKPDEMLVLWTDWFSVCAQVMKKGAVVYACGPPGAQLFARVVCSLEAAGFYVPGHIVWIKNQMVLGRSDYHSKHENIVHGWLLGGPHHVLEDRTQTSVWEYDKPRASKLHPTMKPLEIMVRMIENSSKPGALVLEPFGGSGTTLLAAEHTRRVCYASEIDPAYCDVIVQRWEEHTGKKATLE